MCLLHLSLFSILYTSITKFVQLGWNCTVESLYCGHPTSIVIKGGILVSEGIDFCAYLVLCIDALIKGNVLIQGCPYRGAPLYTHTHTHTHTHKSLPFPLLLLSLSQRASRLQQRGPCTFGTRQGRGGTSAAV